MRLQILAPEWSAPRSASGVDWEPWQVPPLRASPLLPGQSEAIFACVARVSVELGLPVERELLFVGKLPERR